MKRLGAVKSVEVKQRGNILNDADGAIEMFGTSDVSRLKSTLCKYRRQAMDLLLAQWLKR